MATFRQLSLCRLLFQRESIEYSATLASALQPASQSVRQETMVVACNNATYSFLPLFIPLPCSPSHELHFPLVAFSTRNFILPHIRAHILTSSLPQPICWLIGGLTQPLPLHSFNLPLTQILASGRSNPLLLPTSQSRWCRALVVGRPLLATSTSHHPSRTPKTPSQSLES